MDYWIGITINTLETKTLSFTEVKKKKSAYRIEESRNKSLHIYCHLIFDKSSKTTQWG